MRFSTIVAVGAVLAVVPVFVAQAQTRDTDSTGFRAGQWGAEFSLATVNDYASGAGVLRFLSDRHALVVDLTGQIRHETGDAPIRQDQTFLSVRAGSRWYRPVMQRVAQYATVGVVATYSRSKQTIYSIPQGPQYDSNNTVTGGGVFAELGGLWSVTPHLSLGAAWQADVQYSRSSQRALSFQQQLQTPTDHSSFINASLGRLSLRAGVYF